MIRLLAIVTLLASCTFVQAQVPVVSAPTPDEVYEGIFFSCEHAEKLEAKNQVLEAYRLYEKTLERCRWITIYHPNWNLEIVKSRQARIEKALTRCRPKAILEENRLKKQASDLYDPNPSIPPPPLPSPPRPQPIALPLTLAEKKAIRQIKVLESRINILNANLAKEKQKNKSITKPFRKTIKKLQSEKNYLSEQLQVAKDNKQEEKLKKQIKVLEGKISAQTTQIKTYEEAQIKEIVSLKKEVAELQKTLLAKDDHVIFQDMQRQLSLAQKEFATAKKANSTEVQTLQDTIVQLQKQMGSLQEKFNAKKNIQAVQALQTQIQQLKKQLANSKNQRNADAARLRRTLVQLENKKAELAENPLREEMEELNLRLEKISAEKDVMALALRQSHEKLQAANQQLTTIKNDTLIIQEEKAKIDHNLKTERRTSNQVVKGLRQQIRNLNKSVNEKDLLLAKFQKQTVTLTMQLQEANTVIDLLTKEKETLLAERDQFASLLNVNEPDRVQQLLVENMVLGKKLREAQERLTQLFNDGNVSNDNLLLAKHDLAVAKERILELRKETNQKETRLSSLDKKLQDTLQELQNQSPNKSSTFSSSKEVALLQKIIQRQILAQERRRQAKGILLDHARRLGEDNPDFLIAIETFSGLEFQLTDEESEILASKHANREFRFAGRPSEAERVAAGARMQVEIEATASVAKRAFSAERFYASRQLFETILDTNPGHIPSILNLGTVNLKLQEYDSAIQSFENAIILRGVNSLPAAHYKLGVVYYEIGKFSEAKDELLTAAKLDPTNAQCHVFLGSIAGEKKRYDRAEKSFQTALKIDPTLTDPLYNLAFIHRERGNKKEAQKYYLEAVKKGAAEDLEFAKSIGI